MTHSYKNLKTVAIISHPDAGKTTVTEKFLLLGGAIQVAGTVKGKKNSKTAASDWMKMEKDRGISITTSVMQFPYQGKTIHLLDTPGHEDFSEDTYRTLTAVDSCLMVIDSAKGVEDRTIKLMEVCRLRKTPIITFMNKMDREARNPIEVMDEIEKILKIKCVPIVWPLGMGKTFQGFYNILTRCVHFFSSSSHKGTTTDGQIIGDMQSQAVKDHFDATDLNTYMEEIELIRDATEPFSLEDYLTGKFTPVFFGTALRNFGLQTLLDYFVRWAPEPQPRATTSRVIHPQEEAFSGFVFKIQANMDLKHRDRIAFLRICSGQYEKGMKMYHVRAKKNIKVNDAVRFMAGQRVQIDKAVAGEIIGLHNHGTMQVGDTFTLGEKLKFSGIPSFAPELFRRVRIKNPLKIKQLQKGLRHLCEEGATQLFTPLANSDMILGAVGTLQFDVVMQRLREEYQVDALFEPAPIQAARWIVCSDPKKLEAFKNKCALQIARDGAENLTYLAPTQVNLTLAEERFPEIQFLSTMEK